MAELTGAPLPQFSDDDVVDFCVKEVIAQQVGGERLKAEKAAERKEFRKGDTSHLESVA